MNRTTMLRLALSATTLGSLFASHGAAARSRGEANPPWAAEGPATIEPAARGDAGSVPPPDLEALTHARSPEGHMDVAPALPFGGLTVVLEGTPGSDGVPVSAERPAGWVDPPSTPYGDRACVDCINTDLIEGEPVCSDGYVDAFNGGCNYSPNVFGSIECGQTVCGKYGTHLSPSGSNFRDTDWYRFTLRNTATVTWTVTGTARSRAFILNGASGCPAASIATAVADPCLPAVITVANLAPGTYYAFAGTDAFTGVACGSTYRATLEVSSCCASPQPGDIVEPEIVCSNAYVDATNGGCNFTPNVFGTIRCGQTIAGTYGTFLTSGGANFRDTDWYAFTLPAAANVTWTALGEARTRVFILGNGAGTCPAGSLGTAVADPCQPATIQLTNLAAGTYFAFVGTDAFSGVPCGSRYRASLSTSTCVPPQPGDTIEPEQVCAAAYVDATNGGCNFTPNVFGSVRCGETIAGTYGTYLTSTGSNFRDTDWFAFTLTQTSSVTWSATGEARTRIFLLGNGAGTCPASSLATAVADPGNPATVSLPSLAAGTYFAFVGTDSFSGVPCGAQYRATLTTDPCCPVAPRPGDRPEGEQRCSNGYTDVFNGGCNFTPNTFDHINCGDTVAGTYGTYLSATGSSFRDTDWYRFTLDQPAPVTFTALGEAATRVFILNAVCPTSTVATASAPACQPATISLASLAAGHYYAFVGTEAFSGVPCGSRYRATLSSPICAPPCDPDVNQDGNVDQDDVSYLINVVGGGSNPSGIDPDFNHDGNVDQDDVSALIDVVAGGACP